MRSEDPQMEGELVKCPHFGLQYPVTPCPADSREVENAMDIPAKALKSGPFGTKEPNKKHMTSCVITRIHRGEYSWYRTRRDEAVKSKDRASVSLYLANQNGGAASDSGGALF